MDGTPLLQAFKSEVFPLDRIAFSEDASLVLSKILVTKYEQVTNSADAYNAFIDLASDERIEFSLIGIDAITISFGENAESIHLEWQNSPEGFFFELTGTLELGIQNNLLTPVIKQGNDWVPDPVNETLQIPLSGGITIDDGWNISLLSSQGFSIPPCEIASTGIVIEINDCSVFYSDTATPPANTYEGFKGLYINEAKLYLPNEISDILPDGISITNASIGSGGFSGNIELNWENEVHGYDEASPKTFLGFGFTLQSLEIEFKQNTLTKSSITGFLKVPFFEDVVLITVGLTNDGEFTVVLDSLNLQPLAITNVISFDVTTFEIIKENNGYAIKLSGAITPLIAGISWPTFELKGLTINTDGTVKVDGGWIELPEQKAFDFHGFKIEIAKLGFGSDKEGDELYKWVGFSGGIQIIEALPLRGGMEGLKVMWAEPDLFKLKIGGVDLAFEVDNVVKFNGSVNFIDEADVKEFRGGVDLTIIPINLGIDAQFITGRTLTAPLYNYFYLAIAVDFPVGIPLGPPVLGLYGLAGLYANNMTLDYQSLLSGYNDVDTRPDLTDASPAGEWVRQQGAMAFGAGLTIGTLPDVKFTTKVKALFVVLVPGPVLLIEGYAGMLSTGDDYIMRVLAVLDPIVGSFLLNISATYQFPKNSGALVDISGSAEAFFSASDPNNWHLYLGQNNPESKRITASIYSLFKAQTYLMVDHKGILMGAWIGYGLNKKYGILRVILEAWIGGEVGVSTTPLQAKGALSLCGNAELSAGIVSLGISVLATVAAQAPKPLNMHAALQVQLKTPLGKPKATVSLKWQNTLEPLYPLPLSKVQGIEHTVVSTRWEVSKYSEYEVDDDGLLVGEVDSATIPEVPVVPPDVLLVLNFDKPVWDKSEITANPPTTSSTYEKVGDYEFSYELRSVTLQYRNSWDETENSTTWQNYVTDEREDYTFTGYWQIIPGVDQGNTKLYLNATTPFEISRSLAESDLWYTQLATYNPEFPCPPSQGVEQLCADVEERSVGTYGNVLEEDNFIFTSPHPLSVRGYVASWLNTKRALTNTDGYKTTACVNIKAQAETERLQLITIKDVLFVAGVGYDSYLKLTDEYSRESVELYLNVSLTDLPALPATINFPQQSFPALPYKVWITCIVENGSGPLFKAFAQDNTLLDTANFRAGNGQPVVYELKSSTLPIRHIAIYGKHIRIIDVCYEQSHTVETVSILVTPPEHMVFADLHLSKSSQGTIYLYNQAREEVSQIPFSIPSTTADSDMEPVRLSLSENIPFRSFLVVGEFDIIRVCGVTPDGFEINNYNQSVSQHLVESIEETWGKHTDKLLEPDTYYRVEVVTASRRRKNGGSWDEKTFTEYMFFKTGNPPGPAAQTAENVTDVTKRYDLEGPLSTLAPYVEYTIPAGGGANDVQQRAYRSYDVGLVYSESYVDQLYLMSGIELSIRLLDNNNVPITNSQGDELELQNVWGDNPVQAVTREETRFEELFNTSTCTSTIHVTAENKAEVICSSRELLMKPLTQYRAQVMAGDKMVYEFAFLTSRYASFLHHVHSFEGVLWNHFVLLQDESYQINRSMVAQIRGAATDEFTKCEQLMILTDLNPRTTPERVEITLINDNAGAIAFLVESPEPLDWERTELNLRYTPTAIATTTPVAENVTIIGGSINPITNSFNDQWIDILIHTNADLNGYTLEYVKLSEADTVVAYHTFNEGEQVAGAWLRVFNGSAPGTRTAVEYQPVYANHNVEFSESILIQLRDSKGTVIHTCTLVHEELWTSVGTEIIRSSDGARCWIFPTSQTIVEGGYQLRLNYNRFIGAAYPRLTRFTSDSAEATQIQFVVA